jgi:hypothetical protein
LRCRKKNTRSLSTANHCSSRAARVAGWNELF